MTQEVTELLKKALRWQNQKPRRSRGAHWAASWYATYQH
jgi:hypothetical protein